MRPLTVSAVFSMAVVLGCTACSAGDRISKARLMKDPASQQVLIAGIDAADDTSLSTDIRFHILNTGDTALDILIWNTPLEPELSADIFTVTLDGVPMSYQGRMVKRSTPAVKDYLNIPAHQRVEALIDLSVYYEMSEPGTYQVSLTPSLIDGQYQLNEQTPVQLDDTTTLTLQVAPE